MDIKELFAKSHTFKIVSSDTKSGMINHSYMLISADTMLMREYAKLVASTFLCSSGHKPCGECVVCRRISHGNYSDVITYPQGDKAIMTEDINEIVLDELVLPLEADKKIYILYDFDKATVQAQNKLLKTLEEPSKSVIFILTATNIDNVLPTIRSRSKKIVENILDDNDIAKYLIDTGVAKSDAVEIASRSFGNLTYAVSHAGSKSSRQIIELSKKIFNEMQDSSMVLKYASLMLNHKDNLEEVINQMFISVNQMIKEISLKQNSGTYNLSMYNVQSLLGISKLCELAVKKIKANCNPNSVVDGLLMGILEVRYKCTR